MRFLIVVFLVSIIDWAWTQSIPSDRVVKNSELIGLLKDGVTEQIKDEGTISESDLATYFRQKFSERFFYDYKSFYDRLPHYNKVFNNQSIHKSRALDHLSKYHDSTQWVLPFNYINGDPVNAYALRHLARQHKMVDIAFLYFNGDKNPELIRYFENQMQSLNDALLAHQYETIEDGNGVYEAFRSGYRILNWLWIHNMFLNESEYSDKDQLATIATLLQHGQHLYERNDQFRSGNHQTRGVSALAMLSILFQDFVGTGDWYERAMLRLTEHLNKEINDDGFQFERSLHYHMSDINNYFYVYQLAKLNEIDINQALEQKLRKLFTTLVKVAYPDRSAPVLQDDTEIPWAEKNDISGAMTLGYLLFEDPEFGYFASDRVDERVYWFLSNEQVKILDNIEQRRPTYESLAFTDTHYYIMREGWESNDKMMIISAGLDGYKPDHQHGDMLGIQAMANGRVILPNYQVRYSLKDLDLFKNSIVKNVALVDDELQGKKWTSNKGGSGFGKFRELPIPEVISWEVYDEFDFFAGRHNGFQNVGVQYSRQVIFVKDDFWIVKDNFSSSDKHDYKQVWQGHYTNENGPNLLRSTTPEASGHDILQLYTADRVQDDGRRGKQWSIITKSNQSDYSFLTVIYPYQGYNNRLDEEAQKMMIGSWKLSSSDWETADNNSRIISYGDNSFFFNVNNITSPDVMVQSSGETDFFLCKKDNNLIIYHLGTQNQSISIFHKSKDKEFKKTLEPGQKWTLKL